MEQSAGATPVVSEPVKLAASTRSLTILPHLLAKSEGFYEAEGLDVEVLLSRSDLQVAGLLASELTYVTTAGDPIILAIGEGAPLTSILVACDATHFTLLGQPGMDRSQLKGARIGVSRLMSASHLDARAMVKVLGFNPDTDVSYFAVGETSLAYAALETRNVDAAILSPPFSSELVSKGYPALAHASDIPERYPFVGLTTSREQLQRRPDQAVKMSRALLRSMRVMVQDKPRIREVMIQDWDVPPGAADAAYDELVRPLRPDGRMTDEALQAHLDRSHGAGLINRPLKVSDVYDFSYLEQAARTR
jgi:NitT/TauT family transport system substrate-binding protein